MPPGIIVAKEGFWQSTMSATMSFGIQRLDREDFQVLSVSGYMGNDDCERLEAELEQLYHHGHRLVVIDFAALTFVTSASLGRLAKQARWFLREGGEIRLCGLPTSAARLLKLARLDKTLSVAADLAAAVQSVPTAKSLMRANKKLVAAKRPLRRGTHKTKAVGVQPS